MVLIAKLESSPKGDSHGMSNVEAESAVGITQGLARTLKDFVEHKSGKAIDPKSPLLGWLIEHVGTLYTLYAYDDNAKDGLTPYRKIKGRDWNIALPPFGECVYYRVRTTQTNLCLSSTARPRNLVVAIFLASHPLRKSDL